MARTPEQNRAHVSERRERLLSEARALLGGKCQRCDVTEPLDFDHIDPKTKLFNISRGTSKKLEVFWAEVQKCQLLCRPHHEEKGKTDGSQSFPGEFNGRAKLRDLDVRYIRKLYELGHSQVAIAREFDVSPATVCNILRGKNWTHVV